MGGFLSLTQIALEQLARHGARVALLGPFLSYEDASELVAGLPRRFPDIGLVLVTRTARRSRTGFPTSRSTWCSARPPMTPRYGALRQMLAWLIGAGNVDMVARNTQRFRREDGVLHPVAEETEVRALHGRVVHGRAVAPPRPLAPISATADEGEHRVIAVVSPKGGLGKTTVATNLAIGLARLAPLSVVLVDADVQFGDVATALASCRRTRCPTR